HKKGSKSGKEIGRLVHSYISELDEVGKNRLQTSIPVKKWKKPLDRVVKINFDAAYEGGQNKAAIGVVARDKEGSVLLSCSEWEKVIIEGDSLSIIRKCKTKSPNKSLVSAYIHDIHQLVLNFKECRFEHIPRLENNEAHILATEAFKSNRGDYLVGRVPEVAETQAENERVREPD
ncbi:hypothetical protein Godav_021856, partial [Gossypium davidsonii]|nr:hypothetical protein [Gossypium davidsonii]